MGIVEYWEENVEDIDRTLKEMAGKLYHSGLMLYQLEGGKRLRPTVCLLVFDALGGGDREKALRYGCAIEMMHCATLTHDDFLDAHETRRGRTPLHKKLDPRRAVLLADMLLVSAVRYVSARDGSMKALSEAIYNVCRGVLSEPSYLGAFLRDLYRGRVPEHFYEFLIRLKTAELFATACKLGAIVASAEPRLVEDAYRYGVNCGEAYQVADDLVDLIKVVRGDLKPDRYVKLGLAPFVAYFSPSTSQVKYFIANPYDRRMRYKYMKEAALKAIGERLDRARTRLSRFPENRYTRILRETPEYLIGRMLSEVGWRWKRGGGGRSPEAP